MKPDAELMDYLRIRRLTGVVSSLVGCRRGRRAKKISQRLMPALAITQIFFAVIIVGCTMGPDYIRPHLEVPTGWRIDYRGAVNVANTSWWKGFDDPQLDALILEALRNNKDVHMAAARVEESRSQLQVANSASYPQLGYNGFLGRQRLSQNQQFPPPSYIAPTYTQHYIASDAGWELDLWGRVRRSTEAALADLLSSEEGQRGVILSLVSDVATGYIQLLALDKELQIAKQTLKLRREWMGLAEAKYVGGVISKLELSQVRALYDEAAAAVPDLERRVALQENALSILLGRNPGYIVRGDTLNSLNVPRVPADVPSVVLGRRPDVLVAEQDLIAANARIGVAKTEYFPTISLTSKFGLESSQLSNWLDRASGTGELFGGSVAGPLFSGGKISGDVKRTKAIKNEKMSAYLKVVQGALADVDNALVSHQKMGEQLVALRRQVSDLRDYATLAEKRYESGYSSYIEVLYAARSLYAAEIAEAQAKRDVYLALIGVYKAMGGGWPIPHKPYDETLLRVRAATTRETNP